MADYMDPKGVLTPKSMISGKIEVLVDRGEWAWSLCRLTWDGKPRLGMRWNGSFRDRSMGNPQSRGKPTWFILPEEMEPVILKAVEDGALDEAPADAGAGNGGVAE